jgi:hypothetical protein
MRLRKFLIILGIWVAILPHLGFAISTENVLFSITGFSVIVASFYLAALEDKHKNKRVIQGELLQDASQKAETLFGHVNRVRKQAIQKITPEKKQIKQQVKIPKKEEIKKIINDNEFFSSEKKLNDDNIVVIEADDGRPRIKKAVSDVKIKTDSIDDLVS